MAYRFSAAVLLLGVLRCETGHTQDAAAAGSQESAAQAAGADKPVTAQDPSPAGIAVPGRLAGVANSDVTKLFRAQFDEILEQARTDQDLVRAAVRVINSNIARLRTTLVPPRCERVPIDLSASEALLKSEAARKDPKLLSQRWIAANTWVLRHPIVIAHPEVLRYRAVQRRPRILDNPDVANDWTLLDSEAVRANPNLLIKDAAGGTTLGDDACEFIRSVSRINGNLLVETYGDSVRQNGNLSNQVATRLAQLVNDSEHLSSADERKEFLNEYELLTDRYLHSRQFRLGFGAIYSYLPAVISSGAAPVDLTPFVPLGTAEAGEVLFNHEFRNESLLGPFVSAKAPYFDIDFVYPNLSTTQTTTTPVQAANGGAAPVGALFQSTTTSTLSVEYEFAIRVGIGNLMERHRIRSALRQTDEPGSYYPKNDVARFDWGVGLGLSGYKVEDTTSTDVRLPSGSTSFHDLPSAGIATSMSSSSFNNAFLVGYYRFRISDEFEVGIDYRHYGADNNDGFSARGDTLSMTAAYYPTFRRKLPSDKRKKDDKKESSGDTGKKAPKDP